MTIPLAKRRRGVQILFQLRKKCKAFEPVRRREACFVAGASLRAAANRPAATLGRRTDLFLVRTSAWPRTGRTPLIRRLHHPPIFQCGLGRLAHALAVQTWRSATPVGLRRKWAESGRSLRSGGFAGLTPGAKASQGHAARAGDVLYRQRERDYHAAAAEVLRKAL